MSNKDNTPKKRTRKRVADKTMEYTDPTGQTYSDLKELASGVLSNYTDMEDEILEQDSDLKKFLRACGLDDTVNLINNYSKCDLPFYDDGSDAIRRLRAFMSAYYLAILLDPDLNFPVWTEDGWDFVSTVDELLAKLSIGAFDNPMPLSPINQVVLNNPALIVWLATIDSSLADRIQQLYDNCSEDLESIYYNSTSAYRIAYELNPEADLFFNTDKNSPERCYTIPQIGEFLNRRLNLMALNKVDQDAFIGEFDTMETFPIGDFCRARGEKYMDLIFLNMRCMDYENEENTSKVFPYDMVIGAYKTVACFLGHAPSYPIDDSIVTSPEQLKHYPKDGIESLMNPQDSKTNASRLLEQLANSNKTGGPESSKCKLPDGSGKPMPWLYAWLSIFYQENPKLHVENIGTYEQEVNKYTEFIGKVVPKDYYYQRYHRAINTIDKAAGNLRKSNLSVKAGLFVSLLLGGIPTILVLLFSWLYDYPVGNPIHGHFITAATICSIACIASLCFGTFGSGKLFISGLLAGILCAALAWAGFKWAPSMLYFIAGFALLAGFIFASIALVKCVKGHRVNTDGVEINPRKFDSRQLEALYFAYRETSQYVECPVTRYSSRQRDFNRSAIKDIIAISFLWIPLVWMICVLWILVTPELSGSHTWHDETANTEKIVPGQWATGRWVAKYAGGHTRIVCNIDSVVNGKEIYGTMEIAGQAPVNAKGIIKSENDTVPQSFSFHPVEDFSPSKQEIDAEYSKSDKTMSGYYYDRKGIMHQIIFLSTPLASEGKTQKKVSSSSTGTKKKTRKKVVTATEQSQNPEDGPENGNKSDNLPETKKSPVSGLWKDTM